jgi:hypothetical protein
MPQIKNNDHPNALNNIGSIDSQPYSLIAQSKNQRTKISKGYTKKKLTDSIDKGSRLGIAGTIQRLRKHQ